MHGASRAARETERERKRTRVTIVAGRGHDTGSKRKKKKEKKRKEKRKKRSVKEGSNRGCTGQTDGSTRPRQLSVKRPRHTLLSTEDRDRSTHSLTLSRSSSFFLRGAAVPGHLKGKWCSFYHLPPPIWYSAFRWRFVTTTRWNVPAERRVFSRMMREHCGSVREIRVSSFLEKGSEPSEPRAVIFSKFIHVTATVVVTSSFLLRFAV